MAMLSNQMVYISSRAFHQLYRCEALYGSQADAQQQGDATKPPHGKWVAPSSKPLFLVFLLLDNPIGGINNVRGYSSNSHNINNVNPGLIMSTPD